MQACHMAILSPPPQIILTVFGLMTLSEAQAIQRRTLERLVSISER